MLWPTIDPGSIGAVARQEDWWHGTALEQVSPSAASICDASLGAVVGTIECCEAAAEKHVIIRVKPSAAGEQHAAK